MDLRAQSAEMDSALSAQVDDLRSWRNIIIRLDASSKMFFAMAMFSFAFKPAAFVPLSLATLWSHGWKEFSCFKEGSSQKELENLIAEKRKFNRFFKSCFESTSPGVVNNYI